FDGKGYPEGLAGTTIPLTARILAVADAFDAMTSPRTFRDAKTPDEALAELKRSAGKMFDPQVVDALVASVEDIPDEPQATPPTNQRRPNHSSRTTIQDPGTHHPSSNWR
ncbi:hypothetical protein LCGC14_2982880, partial [marine sediment metagenome]